MRVAFVGRKQVLDFLPLRVRQIAWIAFVLHTITFTLLFGPHEVTPCWRMENMGAPQSNRLLSNWGKFPGRLPIVGLLAQHRNGKLERSQRSNPLRPRMLHLRAREFAPVTLLSNRG